MKKLIIALAFLLLSSPAMADMLTTTVSIAPLKYFVTQIGGDRVRTEVMVPPGASPATYEPRPRQMANLAQSAIFFAVGVPFERAWLPRMRSASPAVTIVPTQAGIKLQHMAAHHHHDHSHHADAHHDAAEQHDHEHHGGGHCSCGHSDPHIWNSPKLCRTVADNILAALIKADPQGEAVYRANHARLAARITEVDKGIRDRLAGMSGTHFLVYHPSWGYFAKDYGLVQIPVELEGKEPGPRELAEVIELAKKEHIRAIFTQPQFSGKSAATVARAIKGTVVIADPLAENWDKNLLDVAERFAKALR